MVNQRHLKRDVLQKGLCTLCGACLDWCPYLKNLDDHLVMPFDCAVQERRCVAVCPRTPTDWDALKKRFVPGKAGYLKPTPELGISLGILKTQAKRHVAGSQDGGTVTALVRHGLGEAALLTRSRDGLAPEPFWAKSSDEVREAAGSKYLATPSLRLLNKGALLQGENPLILVGRPCQIQAVRKMQVYEETQGRELSILTIGLFCTWQLAWSFWEYLAREYPGKEVHRITIPKTGLEVEFLGDDPVPVPMDIVRAHRRSGCDYCMDMTAELADISVGALQGEEEWNTLIIRTEAGLNWVGAAVAQRDLVVDLYPEEELERLQQAAHNKAQRGLEKIRSDVRDGKIGDFIGLEKFEKEEIPWNG